ncbi:hypothetical protein NDU88_000912 [Pleurodeles waltl]|uniref:Uncharacterized protein n=1 Tax=Pleurodeles waltl TaxID=8319 RepID=A0AAV7VYN8_PLEWA|nr:hypothetical protein NDU88_000912 [Pleurodeles waltl]
MSSSSTDAQFAATSGGGCATVRPLSRSHPHLRAPGGEGERAGRCVDPTSLRGAIGTHSLKFEAHVVLVGFAHPWPLKDDYNFLGLGDGHIS